MPLLPLMLPVSWPAAGGSGGVFVVVVVSGGALMAADGAADGGSGQATLPAALCGCGSGHGGVAPWTGCAGGLFV